MERVYSCTEFICFGVQIDIFEMQHMISNNIIATRHNIQSCIIHCTNFIILNVLNSNFLVTSESYYQVYYSPCKRHVLKLFILAQVRFQGNNNNINRFRLSYNEFCYPYWKNMQSIF